MTIDKKIYIFAVLGNDKRQCSVARELLNKGHRVRVVEDIGCMSAELCTRYDKALFGADFIVLPLPVTRDGEHISSMNEKIKFTDIVHLAKVNNSAILGGLISNDLKSKCDLSGVNIFDYYTLESIQRKNALPSAEGALMLAMENTDITVKGMNAFVCGYGRIGTILADILRKLGANVTVGARREEVLCELALEKFKSVKLNENYNELRDTVQKSDVIFNTVPNLIFTRRIIEDLKNKPIYIEIASSPGGIDLSAARDSEIKIVFAPSIPSKYSPISAGQYVFEAISDILKERGINI